MPKTTPSLYLSSHIPPEAPSYLRNTHLQRLDLQRSQTAIKATQCQIASEEPKARMSAPAPHCPRLAFLVQSPYIVDSVCQFVAEYLTRRVTHILVAGREDYLVGWKVAAVLKDEAMWCEVGYCGALGNFDGARCD